MNGDFLFVMVVVCFPSPVPSPPSPPHWLTLLVGLVTGIGAVFLVQVLKGVACVVRIVFINPKDTKWRGLHAGVAHH